jgi:hypothetical protein
LGWEQLWPASSLLVTLRTKLGRELDALCNNREVLYVSKRSRLAGVLLESKQLRSSSTVSTISRTALGQYRHETSSKPPFRGLRSGRSAPRTGAHEKPR